MVRYLLTFLNAQNAETLELARGIEPPTYGLQKPIESISPYRESPDKIDETLDGSGE